MEHATLHLNAFRGEPAITEFDWPFTPTHSSSPRFSTLVGSVLHAVLPALQPGHGQITRLRVLGMRLMRPGRTRCRYGCPSRVNLATDRNLEGAFFKWHAVTAAPEGMPTLPLLVGTRFQ